MTEGGIVWPKRAEILYGAGMYTVLTTCPDYGSRNAGDRLIEVRLKDILEREKGDGDFVTIFREEPLDQRLDEINASRAVLLPGFAIRDLPIYPKAYRLADDLNRIRVPMIPVGANWNTYPGDAQSRRELTYSEASTSFLQRIAGQVEQFSCREPFVCEILHRHGVTNTVLTGDPALFCLQRIGTGMKRPTRVDRLVFSPPLSPFYAKQATDVMAMLAQRFPAARRFCAFHLLDADTGNSERSENSAAMSPEVAEKNRRIRDCASELGYEILSLASNFEGMLVYDDCDLHVGYECHAHLYFLSVRIPSVLIAEDARGVGFNELIGIGGFNGFGREKVARNVFQKPHTSGYCTTQEELALAPPRTGLHTVIREFLDRECEREFGGYADVASLIDSLYESAMVPFIQGIP